MWQHSPGLVFNLKWIYCIEEACCCDCFPLFPIDRQLCRPSPDIESGWDRSHASDWLFKRKSLTFPPWVENGQTVFAQWCYVKYSGDAVDVCWKVKRRINKACGGISDAQPTRTLDCCPSVIWFPPPNTPTLPFSLAFKWDAGSIWYYVREPHRTDTWLRQDQKLILAKTKITDTI